MILEAFVSVHNAGGTTISCVCDNCKTNVSVYGKLGGPDKSFIEATNSDIFLVFDYVHLFKKIRNNWITERNRELSFIKE
jgi:hypothetical protein